MRDVTAFHGPLAEDVAALELVDHHAHGALATDLTRDEFEAMTTEAPRASGPATELDSQLGFAIRRWCAPLLDLPAHAHADDYWRRREVLGNAEVNRRLLRGSGVSTFLLDTGFGGDALLDVDRHRQASGARVLEVVRLESLAESVLAQTGTTGDFLRVFPDRLDEATASAAAVKSILAYRHGFDIPAQRPTAPEVGAAVDRTLRAAQAGRHRVSEPALLRHLLWCGIDRGLPVQVHTGYGDRDLDLHRADPLLLTPWLRAVHGSGVPVMLLHCYPYHRQAGYLAQVFDTVYFDVGLAVNQVGAQSRQLVAESLELAPFHKQLYSSDAAGPSELHLLGSLLWRRAAATVIGSWVSEGDWSRTDAVRVLGLLAHGNAERVYGLG